jgi:transcriptional regulator with XRE-family HTH domain
VKKKESRPFFILGKNIAERRDRLGLTQDQFAHKVGTSTTGLKNIERGVAEGRIETRLAIADALRCSLSDLYKDPKRPDFGDFKGAGDFLSAYAACNPVLQRIVYALVYKDENLFSMEDLPLDLSKFFQKIQKVI